MLSPESAVTVAMQSLQSDIYEYFRINFPVKGKVLKTIGKSTILLNVGKEAGIKVGDRFTIESVEMLDGKPYPSELGKAKVTNYQESHSPNAACQAKSLQLLKIVKLLTI